MSIRMRNTSGHAGNRRSHHALKNITIVKDKESGNLRLPHRLDEATGMYRGKQIFTPKAKRAHEPKVKGPDTEPKAKHEHEHAHEAHENAEAKASKGVQGKVVGATTRPKARSVSASSDGVPSGIVSTSVEPAATASGSMNGRTCVRSVVPGSVGR